MSNVYCLTFGCTQSVNYKCFYRDPFFVSNYYYYSCTPNPDGTCSGLYPVYLCPSDLCWYDICNPDLTGLTCYRAQCYYWNNCGTYVLQREEKVAAGCNRCHLSILPVPLRAAEPTVFEAKTDGTTWWLEYSGVRDFIPLGDTGYYDDAQHYAINCICEYLISQGRLTRGTPLYTSSTYIVNPNNNYYPAYALNFSCYTSCIEYNANDCPTVVPTYMTVCSSGQPEEKPVVSLSYKDKQVWSYGYSDTSCTVKCYCNFPMDTSPVCFGGAPVDTLRYNNTNNILHKGTISSGTHVDVSGMICCAKWDGEVTYPTNTYCITNPMYQGSIELKCYASVRIPQTCYRCESCFCKTCVTEYNLKVCGVEIVPQIMTYAPDYYYAIPECESSLAIPIKSPYYNTCYVFNSTSPFTACIDKDKVNGFLDDLIDQFVASVPSCFNQASGNYDKLYALRIPMPFDRWYYGYALDCCYPTTSTCDINVVIPVTPDRELIKTLAGICCPWTDCGTYYTFDHCDYCSPLTKMNCCSSIFCNCVNTASSCICSFISSYISSHSCASACEILDGVVDCLKRFNLQIFRGYPTCVDIYSLATPVYSMESCAKEWYQRNIACINNATNCDISLIGNNLCGNCECIRYMTANMYGPAGTQYADKRCWTVSYCSYPETCCLTPIGTVDFSCPYNKLPCIDSGGSLTNFKCPVNESTYQGMANVLFCNGSSVYQFNKCAIAVVPSKERTLAGQIFMFSRFCACYPYNYNDLMEYFKTQFDNLNNTSVTSSAMQGAYAYSSQFICYTPKICYHGMLPVPQFSIGLYKGCY